MRDWKKIAVGYMSLLVLGFLDSVRGPFYPDIIIDLKLSDTLGSLFFVLVSVMTIFSGQVTPEFVRRFGLQNAVRAGHSFLIAGALGISVAPNFPLLAVACVTFGIGFGFINVGQNLLIIEGAKPHRQRQLLSGLHSIYAIASLLAPVCVSFLKLAGADWRRGFLLFTLLPIGGFLFTFLSKSEKPAANPTEPVFKSADERSFVKGLSEWKGFFVYATQISLYIAAELALSTRLVLLMRRQYGMSDVTAPQYLTGFFALLLMGRLIFTFFSFSKFSNHRIISACLASSALFFTFGLISSPYWLLLCGLSMAPVFGLSMDYLTEVFPKKSEAAIASTLAISGIYIITMHFVIGVLTEHFGIGKALFLAPAFLAISFVMLQFLPKKSRHVQG